MSATAPEPAELALRVKLSEEARAKLIDQARRSGRGIDAYASELIEHAVSAPDVDAILAPLRKEFADGGTTDEALIEQIAEARGQHRAARRKHTA